MRACFVALITTFLALAGLVQALPADARGRDSGQTKVFADVYVARDETVDGNVNVVFGDATIAGIVTGDCNTLFGTCTIEDGGKVGGRIQSITDDWVRALVPWAVTRNHGFGLIAEENHRLYGKLLSSAVVIIMFLLFPQRMRVTLDRVERHAGLSAAIGALGVVAMIPVGLLFLVSIIGIPLIPLEITAVIAAVWIGTGAIALLVGRRLCELVMPAATPSPLLALVMGLVVVSAGEIVPFVGWAVTALVWVVGLGATILAFVRSTRLDDAFQRTPIGGPPTTRWR